MDGRVKSEKEELLDKKIEEVRKRNEARLKKFQEAEEDRKRAEEAGCAVVLKRSSLYDGEECTQYRSQRPMGHTRTHYQNKSAKSKKYIPATSEEWKKYIEEKKQNNSERGDSENSNNNNNSNNNDGSYCNNNSNNNIRKERTARTSDRAIYTPKMIDSRPSPEDSQVKPPPPDPKNSFLADSYRSRPIKSKSEEAKQSPDPKNLTQVNNFVTISTKPGPAEVEDKHFGSKRQIPVPTSLGPTESSYQGDARQRINQLRALKGQQQPSTLELTTEEDPQKKDHQQPHHRKNFHNNIRHNRHNNHQSNHRTIKDVRNESNMEKPLKSILKKTKPHEDDYDESHPVIAVITTPGDEEFEEGAQGYNKKKEKAISDWLTKSDFTNDSEDEWEDVDEEAGSGSSCQQEEVENPLPAIQTSTTTAAGEVDEELEAFEENDAAFQQFIKQHTLTLEGEYSGMNWASEMERLSLENKQKITVDRPAQETTEPK